MRAFAAVWPDSEGLSDRVQDLPWGHIATLVAVPEPSVRDWYVERAGAWSHAQLQTAIASGIVVRGELFQGITRGGYNSVMEPIRTDFKGYEGKFVALDSRTGKIVIAAEDLESLFEQAKGRDHIVPVALANGDRTTF